MNLLQYIKAHTQLPLKGIQNTITLLNQDCTIPFIARYRKEKTGNLDEVQIGDIVKYKMEFEMLEKRKSAILKAVDEQQLLTPELRKRFESAADMNQLEDLYLPYKKRKKTKAEVARKNGLEPLAKIIMAQRTNTVESIAVNYLNQKVMNIDEAMEGARHIIAEWINERTDIRDLIRHQLERYAQITTQVIGTKKEDGKAQKYRDYFDWSESLVHCPSHRLLAILRAESEKYIRIKIEIDTDRLLARISERLIKSNNSCTPHIQQALEDAYKRLLFPSLSNECLKNAKEKADDDAIQVFSKNLKQLLLGAPLGEKRILAIDPGFRSGCKVVCLNARGELMHNETIYPHPPQNERSGAMKKISSLCDAYKIEAIAIGNGTASRETEQMVKRTSFKNPVEVFVVSEAGASIYSASKIARDEFPNYDVTVRGAISIGRRLADPLSELVKIDPKSIGVGQYQHDVDQTKLKYSLDKVVESCVNSVGVNINTASVSLLSYVSGIGPKLAENIIAYRNENGSFPSRTEIKKVHRLGEKAFEQGAAFLRVKGGKNPLDDSAVHPESYRIVEKMAKDQDLGLTELIGNTEVLKRIDLNSYCSETVGLPTLTDILDELEKPGLDTREKAKVFTFNQNIRSITDLREGQLLPGIVNNITNFGCFVDIGIKESGLIHISNLSDTYIKDINDHVHLHQQIIVKVLSVDIPRKRIQLALHRE
ncbi:RNA-binding transcriptional accessory protein [Flavobacteriaceae bacterium TP-CH-4]|uniref:RNA-binding transcriptional accessory protein n=1 Tax=Pelagihabitans pacificus TaxID=2696054 RepID=A0A967AUG2_9FLAO|nr:Tex family protein [Pelagihabitans pacificus]NHF60599.1 RNA-binding transcriptional accessory protein [Pelagihabitans pacificus]